MNYNYDPDRVKGIDDSIEGEPPDGYRICDGVIDYYFDAKEHCFYYLDENNNKCYTSAGFIFLGGDFSEFISCPICRACLNQYIDESINALRCKAYIKPPARTWHGMIYSCPEFIINKKSSNYKLVAKLVKGEQEQTKEWKELVTSNEKSFKKGNPEWFED